MPSGLLTRTSSVPRRLAPWAVVLLIGALLIGVLPSAQAQTGASAADALPITTDGKFWGTDGPSQSLWYKFNYVGMGSMITATMTFEPAEANRIDIFFFIGDASNPTQVPGLSTLNGNVRTLSYSDSGGPRTVFIKVVNDHTDRSVSFVGSLAPPSAIATPTATSAANPATPQSTPTAGPVAGSAANAITLTANNGAFSGTLSPGQAVWYRFWYGNPGADGIVTISIGPAADNVDLNIYTGSDVTNLTRQDGSLTRTGSTISRRVNLGTAQFVFFSLGNNNTNQVIAYGGNVSPFFAPPATATPTAVATGTATPAPTATVPPAPSIAHDAQWYEIDSLRHTGFRVDDQMLSFFQSRGAIATFGLPVSRVFTFLGCPVQMYQRLIIQLCSGAGPALINLLDPDIFPYTRVNGSVFPAPDAELKRQTPAVGSPEYANILSFIEKNTPDQFNGQPVNFWQTFQARGGLEVLGAPISRPQPDPTNASFIYMRFQRVILHYRAGIGTEPLLLADYLKQIMLGPGAPNLPQDLQQQASSNTRFFAQYCRGNTRWICRPNDLPGSDLTFAFEQG